MPNINLRIALWGALAAILFYGYQIWMHDYPPAGAPASSAQSTAAPGGSLGDSLPQAASSAASAAAPAAAATAAAPAAAPSVTEPAAGPPSGIPAAADTSASPPLHVTTDVLDITINLRGGELDQADLLRYPLRKDAPNVPVRLLSREPPASLYLLQTGLSGAAGEAAPTHLAVWASAEKSFTLAAGAKELRVPLTWTDGQGLTVTKTFVFTRGSYAIDLIYDVQNAGTAPRHLLPYAQILRHWEHPSRSYFDVETYSFKGPAVYDGSKSKDLNVENDTDSKFSETITNGWLASLQHQFVAAIVPSADQPYKYQLQVQRQQLPAERHRAGHRGGRGRQSTIPRKTIRRPQTAVAAGRDRPAPRAHGRLRRSDGARPAAVRGAQLGAWAGRQLGLGHHHRHGPDQIDFLSLEPGQRPFHGQNAHRRAAHETDPGHLQGRSGKTRSRHDGAVQEGKDQSARRLLADAGADSLLHLVLSGAARERGNAPGAVSAVGQRSLLARSLLRVAAADGRRHVRAVQAEPRRRRIPCRRKSCNSCR